MTFLWPLAWGLSALAIPVIGFYLIRTRLQRKQVSTFLFWNPLTAQVYNHSLWRKLRHWISLMLQLLFLFLLILALSQPIASWQSTKSCSVILLVDSSVSMTTTDGSPDRWTDAVQSAQRRIAQLRFFDEAILIAAGETPRVISPWTRNKRSLGRALLAAAPGKNVSDVRSALALAHNLAGQREHAEIFFITDGVWEFEPTPEMLQDVKLKIEGNKNPVNSGITLFSARRSPSAPGEYQLLARVSASADTSVELEVRRDGGLIDVQQLKLAPGKPWQKSWTGTANGETHFEARLVGMKRDDLSTDNVAQTSLSALHSVDVEVVAPPHTFLDAVLDSLPLVNAHRTWPVETLTTSDPAKFYIFYQCLPPEGFRPGSMLLINPSTDGFWGKFKGTLDAALVTEIKHDEPIMRFIALDQVRLDKVSDFTPAPESTVFVKYLGEENTVEKPLLFGQWNSSAPRWLVQSFGLEDSDLVYRTAFPILLANLVQSLQPEKITPNQRLPGPVATSLKTVNSVSVENRDSSPTHLNGGWTELPVWWWALLLSVIWLIAEWGLFSRRITE